MDQINCYAFYELGTYLVASFNQANGPFKNWVVPARNARDAIERLRQGTGKFRFDESSDAARAMSAALSDAIDRHDKNSEAAFTADQLQTFNLSFWRFNEALNLELSRAPIFLVSSKGVYDTRRLISNADAAFEGYADRLPSGAIADAKEAGRCFAFSLYTAAGFHIARATEAVIKSYMDTYGCAPLKASQRNWGAYTKALTEKKANRIVIHHIDQLRELHRNPITHPDVTLSLAEGARFKRCA